MSASRSIKSSARSSARPAGKQAHAAKAAPQGAQGAAQRVARTAAQEVRIIGGQWKRSVLPVPVSSGLRPTPSRIRETLFNWLGQDLAGWRVLDAFAGSGALGFEAASRGAQEVTLLEREPALVRGLQATQARLKATQVKVMQAEAVSWMRQPRQAHAFDLVFLDPPFDEALFWPALQAALQCVPEGGWIYLESPAALADLPQAEQHASVMGQLAVHRQGQAGAVHFHLFQRVAAPGAQPPGPA
jgi:16S rRNA (guanine(966)-N(2))-methyltransferase RsmD